MLLLLLALALVGGLQPASAARPSARAAQPSMRAVALPLAAFYGYGTPAITIGRGDEITFTNLDSTQHDFVQDVSSDGTGGKSNVPWCSKSSKSDDGHEHHHGGECPLFWTPLAGTQENVKVQGLDRVKPGETYTFFCTVHHSMKGTLIVRE